MLGFGVQGFKVGGFFFRLAHGGQLGSKFGWVGLPKVW